VTLSLRGNELPRRFETENASTARTIARKQDDSHPVAGDSCGAVYTGRCVSSDTWNRLNDGKDAVYDGR